MEHYGNDDPKPPQAPARFPSSFPLLWLLLPQICAFAFCENAPWFSEIPEFRRFIAGLVFLFIASLASGLELLSPKSEEVNSKFRLVWKICFPIAAFFLFCAWWNFHAPPLEDWSKKSPREAEVEFYTERMFSASEKNFNGLARIEKISGDGLGALAGTRIWFSVPKKLFPENAPAPGEKICASGVLSGLSPEAFSGSEGFFSYLKRERVSTTLTRVENAEIRARDGNFFLRFCARINKKLKTALEQISDESPRRERAGRILGAMLLGERNLLLPEQKENFLLTGTMHIFAVSGLHVSVLAAGMLALLHALKLPRGLAWTLMLGSLWFYVQIVGAPPSAVRAWTMLVFLFAGTLFGRGRMAFHGLLFSAFFALMLEPTVLGNTGFRLSYLVVAAILLYGIPLADFFENALDSRRKIPLGALRFHQKILFKIQHAAVSGFCISGAAFLAGTPIVIAEFGVCSFISLAANVILIPAVSLAAWTGAFALLIACLPLAGIALGKFFFLLNLIPLLLLDFGTAWLSALPGIAELSFPHKSFGIAGSLIVFATFFFGETLPKFRENPWLRFAFPPLALCVFLLIFSY